jgi:hypothetical protein
MIKKKRMMNPEVQAKGKLALEQWRKEKAYAEKKGGKFLEAWTEEQALKRAQKKTSPMQAIKAFCIDCVATRTDITNCTAKQCSLWIYRPYQKGDEE